MMPRSRYRIVETELPYFPTCTVVDGCRSSRGLKLCVLCSKAGDIWPLLRN
jgi:hypothetical protein